LPLRPAPNDVMSAVTSHRLGEHILTSSHLAFLLSQTMSFTRACRVVTRNASLVWEYVAVTNHNHTIALLLTVISVPLTVNMRQKEVLFSLSQDILVKHTVGLKASIFHFHDSMRAISASFGCRSPPFSRLLRLLTLGNVQKPITSLIALLILKRERGSFAW
jgi:hypothetical protein